MPKPRIDTNCVANRHSCPNERIVEFSGDDPDQGGLISFHLTRDGRMFIDVYRQGKKVEVRIGKPDPPVHAAGLPGD